MTETTIVAGSVEYLYADVTASVALDAQPVEMAVSPSIAEAVWQPAAWQGAAGLARTCRVLLDGTLAVGKYNVWVRITDFPEIPVIKAGVLRVKAN